MSGLQLAWGIALIVTVGALPMGMFRMIAIGSGGFERTRTMVIAAWFALILGLVGLDCLIVFSLLLLA